MADGQSGGMSGVLFEAGKTISDAGKKTAQQFANAATQQVTGSQKPLFGGGPKQTTTGLPSFKPSSSGGTGQMPKLDPFGDFGKMFEKNKPGNPFGAKQPPPLPPTPQFSQEDLDKMAAENSAKDQEEIAKRQAELKQLTQQLHNENYYNAIRDAGKGLADKARQAKEEQAQQEAAQAQVDAQNQHMQNLPGNDMFKGSLPSPDQQQSVAVTQAKTVTEINRGTTG